jgi:hypothetical protein
MRRVQVENLTGRAFAGLAGSGGACPWTRPKGRRVPDALELF